jgi:hypothetical protein
LKLLIEKKEKRKVDRKRKKKQENMPSDIRKKLGYFLPTFWLSKTNTALDTAYRYGSNEWIWWIIDIVIYVALIYLGWWIYVKFFCEESFATRNVDLLTKKTLQDKYAKK